MSELGTSFEALLHLLRYAKGYRRRIILASTCSALNTFFDVMPEILIGVAIDVVVNQEASFLASFGFETPQSQILMLAFLTFLIWAGESFFEYLYLILWRNLAQDLQADLRQDAYDQVQRQDMSFFESGSSGELTAILNDDVNQLERFLDGGANDFLQVFVSVVLSSLFRQPLHSLLSHLSPSSSGGPSISCARQHHCMRTFAPRSVLYPVDWAIILVE